MPWFKVDDGLHSHPKWLAASPGARALWVTAGSWCAAHLTDGRVPRNTLGILGGRHRNAAELVELGLWVETEGGWRFHDWLAFQPSAETVEAEREAARQRQRRAREKARESRRDARRDNQRDSHVIDAVSHGPPDPTRPDLYNNSSSNGLTTEPDKPDDDDPGSPHPNVGAALAVLARRDLHARQSAGHLPPLNDPLGWENTAYDRRQSQHRAQLEALLVKQPDLTADQLADLVAPPQLARAVNGNPLDAQAAASRARAERHLRVARGEACQACSDTGFTLDEDGNAVPCEHQETPA